MDYSLLMGIQDNPDYMDARREFYKAQNNTSMTTEKARGESI